MTKSRGFILVASLILLLALSAVAVVGLRQAHHALHTAQQESAHLQVLEYAQLGLVNAERRLQNLPPLEPAHPHPTLASWPKPVVVVEPLTPASESNSSSSQATLYRIRSSAQNSTNTHSTKRIHVRLESIYTTNPTPQRLSWKVMDD